MDRKGIPRRDFDSFFVDFDATMRHSVKTMHLETAKYVDDHMRTAKVTFDKFFSGTFNEVVNTNKKAPHMPKSSVVIEESVKSSDDISYTDNAVNDSSSSSVVVEEMVKSFDDISYTNNAINDSSSSSVVIEKMVKMLETPMLNASANKVSGEKFTLSDKHKGNDESIGRVINVGSKSTTVVDQDSPNEEEEARIIDEVAEGNGSSDAFEVSSEETTMPFSLNLSGYFDERSNLMSADKIKDNQVLVTEQVEKVNLGQSCVFVEKNECPLTVPLQNKFKSYKKTIGNVFSRRWSKGKQAEDNGKNEFVHIDSHSSDSLDSDWELI